MGEPQGEALESVPPSPRQPVSRAAARLCPFAAIKPVGFTAVPAPRLCPALNPGAPARLRRASAAPTPFLAPLTTPLAPLRPLNPQLIIRWYLRTFNYIDRYYITRHNLQTLKDVGMTCFFNAVYQKVVQAEVKGANPVPEIRVKDIIKDAVLVLIDKARGGSQ